MYPSIATRPDISFAVNKGARAMRKPTASDWNRVKHIFRYLKGTLNYSISYDREENLRIYSDAEFAGDKQTRRSTTGIVAKYHGWAISRTSQSQKVGATSTTKAEIISASEGAQESIWLRRLLSDLVEMLEQHRTLYIDNVSALKLDFLFILLEAVLQKRKNVFNVQSSIPGYFHEPTGLIKDAKQLTQCILENNLEESVQLLPTEVSQS
ncbi:uncharacterized protein LOC126278821 [Schistocerca gregaria]|uniref:uncharacterized protein LOC126278821 n=1 Tax=Schistocerca gregaria TaxID=7010 RepID=UPI00211E7470|nr:uncharacterized protein LOC126278821 [Schistocerca gregaria]